MQALGRRACVGAWARAQVVAGRWASGRAAGARDARGARQERQARARQADAGQACGRGAAAARRQQAAGARAGTAWARRGARLAHAGLGVAWALDGCAGWANWASFGALCTWLSSGSGFGPGSTRYFPESPNEH